MATSRLIAMHQNKGKSIAETLTARIDYVKNPEKTQNGELVTGYACDPETADAEFLLAKNRYYKQGGLASVDDALKGKRDVLAYQIRQAFQPGEITPEECNRLGYELAMRFTKGKHQFIVATHVDKEHIHNHIIFNSTCLDSRRKFRDFLGSGKAIMQLNDTICIENGYSIIEQPTRSARSYGKWLGEKKYLSKREILRRDIDALLEKKPKSMGHFLDGMRDAGYQVREGKTLAFLPLGAKRFIRAVDTLGAAYHEEAIRKRILNLPDASLEMNQEIAGKALRKDAVPFSLLIDIDRNLKAKDSAGYRNWAQKFNAKQMAQTMLFLRENHLIDYSVLTAKAEESARNVQAIQDQLKPIELRLKEISNLQGHIADYAKTKEVFLQYRNTGYSKQFYAQHEKEIEIHRQAKRAFNELSLKKIPTMKMLKQEYAALFADKKRLYKDYRAAKETMKKYVMAKANVDIISPELAVKHERQKSEQAH